MCTCIKINILHTLLKGSSIPPILKGIIHEPTKNIKKSLQFEKSFEKNLYGS